MLLKFDSEHVVSLKVCILLLLFVGWTGALLMLIQTVTQIDDRRTGDILLPDTSLKGMYRMPKYLCRSGWTSAHINEAPQSAFFIKVNVTL